GHVDRGGHLGRARGHAHRAGLGADAARNRVRRRRARARLAGGGGPAPSHHAEYRPGAHRLRDALHGQRHPARGRAVVSGSRRAAADGVVGAHGLDRPRRAARRAARGDRPGTGDHARGAGVQSRRRRPARRARSAAARRLARQRRACSSLIPRLANLRPRGVDPERDERQEDIDDPDAEILASASVNVGAATCGAAAAVAGGSNAAGGGGSVSGNKSSSFDISLHTNAPVEAGSGLAAAAAYTPVAVAPERGGRTMLVLRGGTLIDGTGRTPVREATVVITDGRIETVTTGAAATWPSSAEVIDVAGMTVLPGLIDCHDHLAFH